MALTRRQQADASRARLVESARRCFVERGYEGTSVASVLQHAGMARGALYHYFPGGKLELFAAVFETVNAGFHRRRDALLTLESPLERIRRGIQLFLELCTDGAFAQIALMDAPGLLPGQAGRGSTYDLLLAEIELATQAGELRAFDPEATAMLLYGAVRGAGEFVATAADPAAAVAVAARPLERLVDALSA